MPHDVIGRKTFKYALVVIDVAPRYKDGEALTSKSSDEVAKAFEKIYSRRLKWPETLIVDPGKELMGSVSTLMKEHGTEIKSSEAENHRVSAFVERANETLGKKSSVINMPKKGSAEVARESG